MRERGFRGLTLAMPRRARASRLLTTVTACVLVVLSLSAIDGTFFTIMRAHADAVNQTAVAVSPTATVGTMIGDTFTIGVNITNAPVNATSSYNAFQVSLLYNYTILHGATIDYSASVIGSNVVVVSECIDLQPILGTSCSQYDAWGVATLTLVCLGGSCPNPMPTSGTLFKMTFRVEAQGFSQLHILSAIIGEILQNNESVPLLPLPSDGYFTNVDCPRGSGIPCTSPFASFTFQNPILQGIPELFNASLSYTTNEAAAIIRYEWNWGDESLPAISESPVAYHRFSFTTYPGSSLIITLTVEDSYGATASESVFAPVLPASPPNFQILATPTGNTDLLAGNGLAINITLSSLYQFSGTVTVSVAVRPEFSFNATAASTITLSFTETILALSAGGSSHTVLGVDTTKLTHQGDYLILVNARSGSLSHSAYVLFRVEQPYFVLSCLPTIIDWAACNGPDFLSSGFLVSGQSISQNVMLTSLRGFNGTVSLSVREVFGGSGTSPSLSLSASNITLIGSGTGRPVSVNVTLSISTYRDTSGDLRVTIYGMSKDLDTNLVGCVQCQYTGFDTWVAEQPVLASLSWIHPLTITVSGGAQTWAASIHNPNPSYPGLWIYAKLHVTGITETDQVFTADSARIVILANQTATVTLTFTFEGSYLRNAIIFGASIRWGLGLYAGYFPVLNATSSSKRTGAFVLLP